MKPNSYLQTFSNNQYRYPIDYQNDANENAAIQIKRSYPKNYQQFRLLRSRLPRERPSFARLASRESNKLQTTKELTSSSTTKDHTTNLANKNEDDKSLANEQSSKDSSLASMGDRILNSILTNKLIALKDNEKIASTTTSTSRSSDRQQRSSILRSELLPKLNIAYNNLIKRNSQSTNQLTNQMINHNNNGQLANKMYIQRYSNQTIKNNSTNLKKHLNDAILLTNVNRTNDNVNKLSPNELPLILQNTLLSSDASSIQETSIPTTINTSTIFNLIKNLNLTNSNDNSEFSFNNSSLEFKLPDSSDFKTINSIHPIKQSIGNDIKKVKSSSLLSPLELQLIKLAPTMISN